MRDQYDPKIELMIDDEMYKVDLEEFRLATGDQERDAQRECYFAAESIWPEFLMENDTEEMVAETMEAIAAQLRELFAVPVEVYKCT